MSALGIRKWSFTRHYDIGDGPWPSEDEASVTYDSEANEVVIRGVFFDGDTSWEGCARRVAYVPKEGVLHVDVGTVRTGDRVAMDVMQRIHYEVCVEFTDQLPERTMVRHIMGDDNERFSTTVIRETP